MGEQLPAFRRTRIRKPVATAKFYFFDVGVANTMRRTGTIERRSDAYSRALEHLVFLELRGWLDYRRRDDPPAYWRSRSQLEVDFVIGEAVAVVVKAKSRVSTRDYKELLALVEEIAAPPEARGVPRASPPAGGPRHRDRAGAGVYGRALGRRDRRVNPGRPTGPDNWSASSCASA